MSKQFICPLPVAWNRIYESLQTARDSSSDKTIPAPPIPLILNGWVYSTNLEKALRWQETLKWAEHDGFAGLIPELQDGESHFIGD